MTSLMIDRILNYIVVTILGIFELIFTAGLVVAVVFWAGTMLNIVVW